MIDLPTIVIGILCVAAIIAPIVYFQQAMKKKRNAFLQHFKTKASAQLINVSEYEVWGNYIALGLDTQSNKLYYLKQQAEQEQQATVDLNKVSACRANVVRKVHNGDQIIDRIELVLSTPQAKQAEHSLMFFSKDEFMTHNNELQLVEKWRALLEARIVNKKAPTLVHSH